MIEIFISLAVPFMCLVAVSVAVDKFKEVAALYITSKYPKKQDSNPQIDTLRDEIEVLRKQLNRTSSIASNASLALGLKEKSNDR